MNLDVITTILINAGMATTPGVDIFQHHMPESCTQGILLKLPISGIPINHYIPGFYKGRFQAILRSKDHSFGDAQSLLISKALTIAQQSFTDPVTGLVLMRVLQMYPSVLPVVYPRSTGNVFEWACNIVAQYIIL